MTRRTKGRTHLGFQLALVASASTGCFGLFSLDGYGPPSSTIDSGAADGDQTTGDAAMPVDGDGTILPDSRIVFVTSSRVAGKLGKFDGANELCNAFASDAGLRGSYKAWLSHNENSPSRNFADLSSPDPDGGSPVLVTPSGDRIATSYAELAERGPQRPILETERRTQLTPSAPCDDSTPTSGRVWSNTKPDGTTNELGNGSTNACSDWDAENATGLVGVLGSDASAEWTTGCGRSEKRPCVLTAHLYCFQQR